MIVNHMGMEYHLTPGGQIEFYWPDADAWEVSAHDSTREEGLSSYEAMNHPLLPLLREKFNRNKATTENTHS